MVPKMRMQVFLAKFKLINYTFVGFNEVNNVKRCPGNGKVIRLS